MRVFLYTATTFLALNLPTAPGVSAQMEASPARSVPATGPTIELTATNLKGTSNPAQYVISTSAPVYSDAGIVVVIPSAQTEPERLDTLVEDMGIMCSLLDRKLSQADPRSEARYLLYNVLRSKSRDPFPDFFRSDSYATEGMYIDGYGALFLARVNFPLTAPPEAAPDTEAPEETDQVWAEVRRSMYSPDYKQKHKSKTDTYDALKVEQLKRILTHSMKHAVNIRGLGPEDWVTIAVRGSESSVETAAIRSRSGGYSTHVLVSPSEGSSVLTIRAKKTAVEAFFKKQLTYEQFQKQTQKLTY
jgi:hypothetical protein